MSQMTLFTLLRANHVDIADKLLYNKNQPVMEILLPADNNPLLVLNYLEHLETKTKLTQTVCTSFPRFLFTPYLVKLHNEAIS